MEFDSDNTPNPLDSSLASFAFPPGKTLAERFLPIRSWMNSRRDTGVWPYSRLRNSMPREQIEVATEDGQERKIKFNFGIQDYLGLSVHPDVIEAAKAAIDRYGVHSAASPIVTGRTDSLNELEHQLGKQLRKESVVVFPTGWAAGFGLFAALAQPDDTILIDRLSHSCLKTGARYASRRVRQFEHNDLGMLEELLENERSQNDTKMVFVVAESLYSMDSDSPCLSTLTNIIDRYGAVLILDIAHDLGAMGANGMGLLESVPQTSDNVVLMGSFSKTFASNGGFVASTCAVRDQITVMSPPYTFSNAIGPAQTAVVKRCMEIIFSETGNKLRQDLMTNVNVLREKMTHAGMTVHGVASPIVPVFVGAEPLARLTSKYIAQNGLLANLAEFPGVDPGKARFRFQLTSNHSAEAINQAVEIMKKSREQAQQEMKCLLAEI